MAPNFPLLTAPQTVDLTGLPEQTIRQVLDLVGQARAKQAGTLPADPWDAAAEAAAGLTDYDFGAWTEQRSLDAEHSKDYVE